MWEENLNAKSFPANAEEAYKTSLGYIKDKSEKLPGWNTKEVPLVSSTLGPYFGFGDGYESRVDLNIRQTCLGGRC
jgi:hypothetical protein